MPFATSQMERSSRSVVTELERPHAVVEEALARIAGQEIFGKGFGGFGVKELPEARFGREQLRGESEYDGGDSVGDS